MYKIEEFDTSRVEKVLDYWNDSNANDFRPHVDDETLHWFGLENDGEITSLAAIRYSPEGYIKDTIIREWKTFDSRNLLSYLGSKAYFKAIEGDN